FAIEDEFVISEVPFFILLGILSALCSIYFTNVFFKINSFFKKIGSSFYRLLLGGAALGILIYFIPPLYGEGYDVMNNLLQQDYAAVLGNTLWDTYLDNVWVLVVLLLGMMLFKVIAMSLTFNAGGVGGIFAPVLFMGSTLGHCFALFLNELGILDNQLSVSNFTLVGMTGLMAGVLHAPLTAIFLIAEITHGYDLFVPLMITAAVSFMITSQFQQHSVYTMELAARGELITHDKDQAVLTLMDIHQVIETNFVPLKLDMDLGDIVHEGVLKSSRNIFPVVDKDLNFRGILLLDDIRPLMFEKKMYSEVKLAELMQSAPEIIDIEEDGMKSIMKKFQDCGAWNLPVVKDKKYLGFISKSKLLTAYREKLIEVTV
ncbi:MAG TPA: chloride channel protein, partial [Salinimicrobium sp.]|nr:chloride channel protein [Salinimicrobium sp.]